MNGNDMVLKNFKRLLVSIVVIMGVLVVYGLLTMKEKREPIGITSNAIHKLYPTADTDGSHP